MEAILLDDVQKAFAIAADVATIVALGAALYWFNQTRRRVPKCSLAIRAAHATQADGSLVLAIHVEIENIGELPFDVPAQRPAIEIWDIRPAVATAEAGAVHAARPGLGKASLPTRPGAGPDRIFPKERNLYRFDAVAPPGTAQVIIRAFMPSSDAKAGGWAQETVYDLTTKHPAGA